MWMLLRHAATPAPGTPPVAAAGASAPPLPAPATAVPAVATDRSAAPAAPTPAAAGGAAGAVPNPEDFTPASEPAGSPTVLSPHVRRGTADGVPLYQDAAAAADAHLPQLRLDLHVFASRAQDRFVITARGIDELIFEGTKQNGFIKITVPALGQRKVIERIWLAGGEVLAVNPIRRTLEDLFVELAHQNGGAHGEK